MNGMLIEGIEVRVVQSKHGPTYKVEINGAVGKIGIRGESLPVRPGLERVDLRLVQDVLRNRVFRSDGSGKDVPYGVRGKVEKAVLAKLQTLRANESVELTEKAPPGWSGTVKAMKKHMPAEKAFALAWDMYKKGATPHYKSTGSTKSEKEPELKKKYQEGMAGQLARALGEAVMGRPTISKACVKILEKGSAPSMADAKKLADVINKTGKIKVVPTKAGKTIDLLVDGQASKPALSVGPNNVVWYVWQGKRQQPMGFASDVLKVASHFTVEQGYPEFTRGVPWPVGEPWFMAKKIDPNNPAIPEAVRKAKQEDLMPEQFAELLDEGWRGRRRPTKEQQRTRWMQKFEDAAKKEGGKSGRLDWNTATHLYNQGKTPEEAAKQMYGSQREDVQAVDLNALFEAELEESVSLPADIIAISNYIASKEGMVSESELMRRFEMTRTWAKKFLALGKRAFRGAGIPRADMKRARANPGRYFRELVQPVLEKFHAKKMEPKKGGEQAEDLDALFTDALEEELLTERGKHYFDGKDYYADTAFLNSVRGVMKGMELKHMGFGEFSLEGDGKTIEFDRTRGKKFPGQSGRSHKVYDNQGGKLVKELIGKMEKGDKSELVKESEEDLEIEALIVESLPQGFSVEGMGQEEAEAAIVEASELLEVDPVTGLAIATLGAPALSYAARKLGSKLSGRRGAEEPEERVAKAVAGKVKGLASKMRKGMKMIFGKWRKVREDAELDEGRALPRKGDPTLEITAHGKTMFVKKARDGRDWTMTLGSRVRWGDKKQTLADIDHFKQYGDLPPKRQGWESADPEGDELIEAQWSDALDLCKKVTDGLPGLRKKHFFCRFGAQYATPQVVIEYADVPKGTKGGEVVNNPKQVKFVVLPFEKNGDAAGDLRVKIHYSNQKDIGFRPMRGSVEEVAKHLIRFLKRHDAEKSAPVAMAASLAARLDAALHEAEEDWTDLSVLSWTDADLDYVLEDLEEAAALNKVGKAAVVAALLLGLGEATLSREITPRNYKSGAQTVLTVAGSRSNGKKIGELLKKYGVTEDGGGLTERKGPPTDAATGELTSQNQELRRELERMVDQTRKFVRSVYHIEEVAADLAHAAQETERIRRTTGVERAMQRSPLGNAARAFEAEAKKVYGPFAEGRNAMTRMAKMARISTRRTGKKKAPSVPTGEITATSLVRDVLQITSKLAVTVREAAELGSVAIREAEKLLNQKSVIGGDKLQDRLSAIVQVYLDFRDQVSSGLFKMIAATTRRMNEMTRRLMKMWESVDHDLYLISLPWREDPDFEQTWEDEDIVISDEGMYPQSVGWLEAVA